MKKYKNFNKYILLIILIVGMPLLIFFNIKNFNNCTQCFLTSLTENTIEQIREHPEFIIQAYQTSKKELRQKLGTSFTNIDDDDLFCIFSMIVAYSLAPYGPSFKTAFTEVLHEATLACNSYAIAMGYFLKLAKMKNIKYYFIGWHGGVVGNHAQVFTVNLATGVNLLLDPTIASVAMSSYDQTASGKKVNKSDIVDFSRRNELKDFSLLVKNALLQGKYKPSDMLYCFDDIDLYAYENFQIIDNIKDWTPSWPTFGALKLRDEIQSRKP